MNDAIYPALLSTYFEKVIGNRYYLLYPLLKKKSLRLKNPDAIQLKKNKKLSFISNVA
jgi:hypothetical protein